MMFVLFVYYQQMRRKLHRSLIAFLYKWVYLFRSIIILRIRYRVYYYFFKNVLSLILFKCCSCFSLVLCSHFVGYHLLHVESIDSTLGNFSAKNLFGENSDGENSVRRNFRSAKLPFDGNSFRRKFRSAKIPSAKILSAKIPSANFYSITIVRMHVYKQIDILITHFSLPISF